MAERQEAAPESVVRPHSCFLRGIDLTRERTGPQKRVRQRRHQVQCTVDHRRHLVVVIGPGPTGSEFVVQALDTGCSEAPSPLADGLWCDAEAEGDRRVGRAFGAGENHAGPLDQGVGQGGRPGNSVELILLLVGEREWYQWASVWHGSLPCLKPAAYDTHLRDATLGSRIADVTFGRGAFWREIAALSAAQLFTRVGEKDKGLCPPRGDCRSPRF